MDNDTYEYVIERSMINNGIEIEPQTRGSAWYPSATIKYMDDYYSPQREIRLQGVKVRCVHFINVGSGFTNASGNVSGIKGWGGKFKNPVSYHIVWENDKTWHILDWAMDQGVTDGPKQKLHWDYTITNSDRKASFFAATHRALHAYFCEIHPRTADITKVRIKNMNVGIIWDGNGTAHFNSADRAGGGTPIILWARNNNQDKDRWRATSSIFHELGHAGHWQAVIDKKGVGRLHEYHQADDKLCESWANGIRYGYLRSLYPDYQHNYEPAPSDYTAVAESMMNQGLTLKQIENTVVGESSWNGWRSNVKSLIASAIVDLLFDNPNDVVRVNLRNLEVSGPLFPPMNTSTYTTPAEFTVPTTGFPQGMSFNGFTISGIGYTIVGSANASPLKVRFTTAGSRYITARYTLPGNLAYTTSAKLVAVSAFQPTITGLDSAVPNVSATYEVPAGGFLPEGVNLSSFTVSGTASERSVSNVSAGNIRITFKTKTELTITATYIMPGNILHKVTKIVSVGDPFSATITGTSYPTLNSLATYSVPAGDALPEGVSLTSFTVSGNYVDCTVSSTNLNTGKLTVTFHNPLLYTITAKYKLVGGTTYTCTKTIDKSSELAPPTLSIVAGPPIVATVTNHKAGATYEWVRDGVTLASTSSSVSFNVPLKPNLFTTVNLKCRMHYNGQTSDWNSYRVMLPPVGNTMSIRVEQLTAAEAAAAEAEQQTQSETTTDDSSEDFFSTF